ncbi:hypothetical protein H6F51_16830 [Cyanobacteria bacterium FACHB-DQ100]|nr:hypothetical protein [Cyanobacteria bacterium FACHB-DQ100]
MGQLYHAGRVYTQDEAIAVFDQDWKSLATGVAIPHGLYDLQRNTGGCVAEMIRCGSSIFPDLALNDG